MPRFFRFAATVSRRYHHVLPADPEPGAYPMHRFLTNHSPLASPMHRLVTNQHQRLFPRAHIGNYSKIGASSLSAEASDKSQAWLGNQTDSRSWPLFRVMTHNSKPCALPYFMTNQSHRFPCLDFVINTARIL